MGAKRHYPAKFSADYVWKSQMRRVLPFDHTKDKDCVGMKKIVENYTIVKPKVERIGG